MKKKNQTPDLRGFKKEDYEKRLNDDMRTIEYAANAFGSLVRTIVIRALIVQGTDPRNLPRTDTVRLRLQSKWDVKYLLVGLPRTGPTVPNAGLIRLSEADSVYIYYLLCFYCRRLRDKRQMAMMAGHSFVEPDLHLRLTDQPGERLRRFDGDNVYHPSESGVIMFRDV